MTVSNETRATPGEAAEAAARVPEKRPWSKPEIWTSDGVLWTEGGEWAYDYEDHQYHIIS